MDTSTRKQLTDAARFGRKKPASGRDGIAVTSHPIVTRVATDTLRAGGNAADAALAASVAQTVVEPHMTTICGVLSMLYFDAATGRSTGRAVSVLAVRAAPQLYNTPGVVASFAALLRNLGYAGAMPAA